MAIITVSKLKIKKKKYLVTFSNSIELELFEDIVVKYRLVKDKELDDSLIDEIKKANNLIIFKQKGISYLSKGNKSTFQFKTYLKSKGASIEEVDEIVEEFTKLRYLNDKEYMGLYIDHLFRNGYGKNMIYYKVKPYQVTQDITSELINGIDYDLYVEYGYNLINHQMSKYNKYEDNIKKQKIKSFLYQRGYEPDTINDILKRLLGND